MVARARTARSVGARTQVALGALLVVAVFAAFGGAVGNGSIVLDDPEYVFENPHVLAGFSWDAVIWAFTGTHGSNWHPLTSLAHVLDFELFGSAPAGHHAVNVGLHALAAVLAFVALRRLTGATWTSFAAALLFAVHPLRVESVAWISELKDVLSGVCFFLALLAYHGWVQRPTRWRYALLVAACGSGLLAKPMLVTLPFVLLLLDVWPLARLGPASSAGWSIGARVREKWPLFGLAALSCVATYLVQSGTGAMLTAESIPLGQRILNAPVAVVIYVGKTVWPIHLSPYYPFEYRDSPLVPVACAIGVTTATFLAWRQWSIRPWIAVGWLWFLGMLVPVIGIVQVGGQALADRYTYLPSLGLALIVAFGARAAIERVPGLRWPWITSLAALVVAFGCVARIQTSKWKDTRTLAAHMLAFTERNALAHQMYASAVIEKHPQEARQHLILALNQSAQAYGVHDGLGDVFRSEGRFEEALREYRTEIEIRPTAKTYCSLGVAFGHLDRTNEAIEAFERALGLDPRHRMSLLQLGVALARSGRTTEATRRFESALLLDPRDLVTLGGLAAVQSMAGDTGAALRTWARVLEIDPDNSDALIETAWMLATTREPRVRDVAKAQQFTERAWHRLGYVNASILSTLAAIQAEGGHFADAMEKAQQANELARSKSDSWMVARTQQQVESYRAGQPFRP